MKSKSGAKLHKQTWTITRVEIFCGTRVQLYDASHVASCLNLTCTPNDIKLKEASVNYTLFCHRCFPLVFYKSGFSTSCLYIGKVTVLAVVTVLQPSVSSLGGTDLPSHSF